jgi:hypothetical protein
MLLNIAFDIAILKVTFKFQRELKATYSVRCVIINKNAEVLDDGVGRGETNKR